MRIFSSTIWVLSTLLFNTAMADDPPHNEEPNFIFDGTSFQGEFFSPNQSSVFDIDKLRPGKNFIWKQSNEQVDVDVLQVDLMNNDSSTIASWSPSNKNEISVSLWDNKTGGEIILTAQGVAALADSLEKVLYFRLDWRFSGNSRAEAVFSGTATSGVATSTSTPGNSGSKSRGLTTGAIVGIVVGCVGGVIFVSVVAGCLCFRRRRIAGDERGGSRGVQDIVAEKEARASILDKDQPDTPYSEQNSQRPLHRGLGLAGRSQRSRSVRTESLHTVTGGNDRNSAMYSSLGGAASSAHGTPVIGSGAFAGGHSSPRAQTHTPPMSIHDRSSAMGSPVPRASSQLDRSLSPYRDNAGQLDYVQHHHHVVDGADLVQQQHSNDSTARSPSSLYSNPLDELQPISPESAHENNGAAGAGGPGGVGGASSQPPGHGRSNTPSGIAQQYAHLVEEGMTTDEIRRLEEEERALDEAIEAQVGTSGRQR
ncbi:hypothetical protein LA080_004708 [Diaporthe eres]|nr:hypothetical protein LA080_004708 [Diaporthe eres]